MLTAPNRNRWTSDRSLRKVYQSRRSRWTAWLGVVAAGIFILSGCSHSVPLGKLSTTTFQPPPKKISGTFGVYYNPQFRNHLEKLWRKGDRWDFPLGSRSVNLFDQVIRLVFERVKPVKSRSPVPNSADFKGVIEPRIEAFNFQLPFLKTGTYSAEISYRVILYNRAGVPVVSWVVNGVGNKRGEVGFEFARWPGEAADLAMHDAMKKFIRGFANLPEVKRWHDRSTKTKPTKETNAPVTTEEKPEKGEVASLPATTKSTTKTTTNWSAYLSGQDFSRIERQGLITALSIVLFNRTFGKLPIQGPIIGISTSDISSRIINGIKKNLSKRSNKLQIVSSQRILMLVRVEEWEVEHDHYANGGRIDLSVKVKFKEIDSEGKMFSSDKFNLGEFKEYGFGELNNKFMYKLINEVAVRISNKLMERHEF